MLGDNKAAQFSRRIHNIYAQMFVRAPSAAEIAEVAEQELRALADINLGEGYNREKISRVAEVQRHLRADQARLTLELAAHKITPSDYVENLKSLLTVTASACERILGPSDYVKLFGVPASAAADLVNSSR